MSPFGRKKTTIPGNNINTSINSNNNIDDATFSSLSLSLPLASLSIALSSPLFPPLTTAVSGPSDSKNTTTTYDSNITYGSNPAYYGSNVDEKQINFFPRTRKEEKRNHPNKTDPQVSGGFGPSSFFDNNRDGHSAQCSNREGGGGGGKGIFQDTTLQEKFLTEVSQYLQGNFSSGAMPSGSRSSPAVMTSHVGGEARGRSMRTLFNEMVKRHTRVVPLGYSRGKKNASLGKDSSSPLLETDDFGNDLVAQEGQRRVLILMSDTGGGHRASAEAIKQTFEQEFGNTYKVTVIDLWKEHTPWPFNQMPKSYSFLVKHETLWKVAFHATKPRFVHQPQMAATSAFVAREVAKGLYKYQPDVIVSVHPLMQHIPLRVLRSKGLLQRIPFTTVITDLTTCHPTWFHKLATMCFCPTKDVALRASKAGLKSHQIRIHGLPIRPSFCKPTAPKDELRRELGMDADLPAVILMGGGEGMGPVEATARALAKSLGRNKDAPSGQLIIICGRNKKLEAKLQAIDWPMPTQVKGFITNMPEWMAACDCVISKAGPGTIAESMIRGLPMIINDFIAGQEVGNVPYVVENGAGKFCESPREIAKIVSDWFGPNRKELCQMSENALKLARPDAVFKIVRDLDQLARRKDLLPQAQLALSSG